MREIELKFKVKNPDTIIKSLEDGNCQISPINYQYDTIYVSDLDIQNTKSVMFVWMK